jgi:hypothetical protein
MEIVGVVGQLTVAEVYRSVTVDSTRSRFDLPPLPVNRDDARRQFDKHGLLPCESLLREHLG